MQNNNTTTFAGNIDLSALRKKRFTIDDDENRILELDTSDLTITNRISEFYPKLIELGDKVQHLADDVHDDDEHTVEDLGIIGTNLSSIDTEMRELVDHIFNSNVSEICAPSGSMYDPIGGKLRYEYIITALINLYETSIGEEMQRVQDRMKSHTGKYTD